MLQMKAVEKVYHTDAGLYPVLKKISFHVQSGQYVVIMGRSGSGKTTLLNIMTGVDKPSSGEVTINGSAIQNLDEGSMAEWRGKNIGIVFQFFQLIPTLTVLENLLLPMDLVNKIPVRERRDRALMLLDKVGLLSHASNMPATLSGGEQQRVAIARALANDVSILVADEPTGNLDSKNADIIFNLFAKLRQEGKTIIVVTHEREIMKGVSRKILLNDGEIIEDVTFDLEVKAG